MVTALDKDLKRQVTVDGADYTLTITPEGFRLTGKGKRRPEVELRWSDLLSGDAAMAVALNASLGQRSKVAAEPGIAKPQSQVVKLPEKAPRKKSASEKR